MTTRKSKKLLRAAEQMVAGQSAGQITVKAKLQGEAAELWADMRKPGSTFAFDDSQILALLLGEAGLATLSAIQNALSPTKGGAK